MEKVVNRLLTVKSLVTLLLTAVFAYLAVTQQVSQEFMMIYTTIIGFYFGSQSERLNQSINSATGQKTE